MVSISCIGKIYHEEPDKFHGTTEVAAEVMKREKEQSLGLSKERTKERCPGK